MHPVSATAASAATIIFFMLRNLLDFSTLRAYDITRDSRVRFRDVRTCKRGSLYTAATDRQNSVVTGRTQAGRNHRSQPASSPRGRPRAEAPELARGAAPRASVLAGVLQGAERVEADRRAQLLPGRLDSAEEPGPVRLQREQPQDHG